MGVGTCGIDFFYVFRAATSYNSVASIACYLAKFFSVLIHVVPSIPSIRSILSITSVLPIPIIHYGPSFLSSPYIPFILSTTSMPSTHAIPFFTSFI